MGPVLSKRLLIAFVAFASSLGALAESRAVQIDVSGEVIGSAGPNFMGLQYNGPTHLAIDPDSGQLTDFPSSYADPASRAALTDAGIRAVRVFLDAPVVNPEQGVYDWADIDTAVDEIEASGMAPMLVLHQRDGGWHVGDAQNPWWNQQAGRDAWIDLAEQAAIRYGARAPYFEILNEPNHIHPSSNSYMGFDLSADLFIDAATEIHAQAPNAKVGGPASFGSWEPYTWAKRVLNRSGGEQQLDFVSYHVYATGSTNATDEDIFEMARWYETVPQAIRDELDAVSNKPIELALTEFNTSSVFQLNGELYTDPRNVDVTGGLVAALGWLYSARGGADAVYRFGTTGGFGLIQWPPDYELRPAYHAVRLLHEIGGLDDGAELLETGLTLGEESHLEAFAIRNGDALSVVIVNTQASDAATVDLDLGISIDHLLDRYEYSEGRVTDSLTPYSQVAALGGMSQLSLPARSMTVLRASQVIGDYNADGVVDASDYTVWRDSIGQSVAAPFAGADGDGDGVITQGDYNVWRDQFGRELAELSQVASSLSAAVPEPGGSCMALLAAIGLATRSVRRRSAQTQTAAATPRVRD